MPLYEYQCDVCGRFEVIRKFSDPPLETCPTCGAAVRKLFSSPAIQFKGSGFYITDYPKKDQPGAGKGDSADKSQTTKAEGTKPETAKGDTTNTDTAATSDRGSKDTGEKKETKPEKKAAADSSSPSTTPTKT